VVGRRVACGLRIGGRIECWGGHRFPSWSPSSGTVIRTAPSSPSGTFVALSGGYAATSLNHGYYFCEIRTEGTITCWSDEFRLTPSGMEWGPKTISQFCTAWDKRPYDVYLCVTPGGVARMPCPQHSTSPLTRTPQGLP